jgi:hypothetical protein
MNFGPVDDDAIPTGFFAPQDACYYRYVFPNGKMLAHALKAGGEKGRHAFVASGSTKTMQTRTRFGCLHRDQLS